MILQHISRFQFLETFHFYNMLRRSHSSAKCGEETRKEGTITRRTTRRSGVGQQNVFVLTLVDCRPLDGMFCLLLFIVVLLRLKNMFFTPPPQGFPPWGSGTSGVKTFIKKKILIIQGNELGSRRGNLAPFLLHRGPCGTV